MFFINFLLLYLRRPDVLNYAQFWSEDGKVFFLQQLSWGLKKTICTPYLEYLLTIQRLIAAFAALWPTSFAPYIYNLAALSIQAASCSLFALPRFRYLIRSDALRILICFACAAAIEANEILGTITNIQWYLALAATLMIFAEYPIRSRRWTLARTAFLGLAGLLIGLTSPQCIILLPLAIWRIFRNRGPEKLWPILLAASILTEFLIAWHFHTLNASATRNLTIDQLFNPLITAVLYRPVLSTFLGAAGAQWVSVHHSWLALLSLMLAVCWLTLLWQAVDRKKRWCLVVCFYLLFSSIILPFVGRGEYSYFQNLKAFPWSSERFYVLGAAIYIFLVGLSLEAWNRIKNKKALLAFFLLFVSGGLTGNFRSPARPDFHWFQEAKQIDNWVAKSHESATTGVLILYPPGFFQWGLILPCKTPNLTNAAGLEGCLITPSDTTNTAKPIYFVQAGNKRHLTTPNWFLYQSELHFPQDLKMIPQAELDLIPTGKPLD